MTQASLSAPSPLALRLGFAGLLPFVLGAASAWAVAGDAQARALAALVAYGALIASFLGGIHWGLALRQPSPHGTLLAWGVVPSLLGWPAVLLPPLAGLLLVGATLIACYAVDRRVYPRQGAAAWLPLRGQLTLVASLSCLVGAAAL